MKHVFGFVTDLQRWTSQITSAGAVIEKVFVYFFEYLLYLRSVTVTFTEVHFSLRIALRCILNQMTENK